MNEDIQDLIADNLELTVDYLLDNDIIKEIPILGSSLKIIRGIKSIRDRAYLAKVQLFVANIGKISEAQRLRLISESRKNEKSRTKFGDAIFTTIEKSDSTLKIEYCSIVFEAFLNLDISDTELRYYCHIINNTFADDLLNVIENEKPNGDLKYLVSNGLSESIYETIGFESNSEPYYVLSSEAEKLRLFWKKYGNGRKR